MIDFIKTYKGSITRTVILFLGLINQFLTMTGHAVLPFSDEEVTQFVTGAITFVTIMQAYWFDNFSKKKKENK